MALNLEKVIPACVLDWLDIYRVGALFAAVVCLQWFGGLVLSMLESLSFTMLLVLSVVAIVFRWYVMHGGVSSVNPSATCTLSSEEFGKEGKEMPNTNPASGQANAVTARAYSAEEVEEIVKRARKAQEQWAKTSLAERRAVLSDLMAEVLAHEAEICQASIRDSGKTLMEAQYGEILTTCEKIRYLIAHGHKAIRPETRAPPLFMWFVKRAWVEYYPLGVIGIIVPWNYPFHNVASAVVAALFSGNAAVVKVSEYASSSRDVFERLFRRVLVRRGHSQDLVTLMSGYGDTGAALCRSKGVDKIHFIGSTGVGQRVMEAASSNATPVVLELGGKDPFIVFEDADIEQAVDVGLRGAFVNNGQNCIAAERFFVHQRVFERFKALAVPQVKALRQGDSSDGRTIVDCGCITMEAQLKKVEALIADAVSKGAVLECGGKRRPGAGYFLEPTVLSNIDDSMAITHEETFGPVMLLRSFSSDAEVVGLANDCIFGLGCSVFSQNRARAEAVAEQIRTGMVTINDFGVSYLIQDLPFGGVGMSGFGRFNGPEGLREFSRQKTVVSDRFGLLTRPPNWSKFPVHPLAPAVVQNAIRFIYHANPVDRVRALVALIPLLRETEKPKQKQS